MTLHMNRPAPEGVLEPRRVSVDSQLHKSLVESVDR